MQRPHLNVLLISLLVASTFTLASAESVLAGFQTTTDVTDYASIDLDQQYINRQVDLATQDAFEDAKSVYELGAFSKSTATLQLTQSFGMSLPVGSDMAGRSDSGSAVTAVTAKNIDASDTIIQAQYISDGCNVGGLAASSPVIDGCFASEGALNIEGNTVQYTSYTATTDTFNGRTLQSFSIDAESSMTHPGSDTFYPDYDKFVSYYGSPSYADDIVQAAFLGRPTELQNGNIDFTLFGYEGRAEAVKTVIAYMGTVMKTLAQLEAALYACLGCSQEDCRIDAIGLLDRAVALYTGSLEGASGTAGDGVGLYSLAELRGVDFFTSRTGKSQVNTNVFTHFNQMKSALSDGNCAGARAEKLEIAKEIFVPLIQSTLRWTWLLNATNADEAAEMDAITFAASVLPVVSACSTEHAETIHVEIQSASPDFTAVKTAFESTYECMDITCEDVGGYWDVGNKDYYPGAAPCSVACGLAWSWTALLLALCGFVLF